MAGSTSDDEYWKSEHAKQPYADKNLGYEHYEPAYRTGIEAAQRHAGKRFEEIEDDVALDYEKRKAGSALPWDRARPAVKAAWDKLSGVVAPRDVDRGTRSGM
jgi:hypothetical protein